MTSTSQLQQVENDNWTRHANTYPAVKWGRAQTPSTASMHDNCVVFKRTKNFIQTILRTVGWSHCAYALSVKKNLLAVLAILAVEQLSSAQTMYGFSRKVARCSAGLHEITFNFLSCYQASIAVSIPVQIKSHLQKGLEHLQPLYSSPAKQGRLRKGAACQFLPPWEINRCRKYTPSDWKWC